jgi:hypothetical protein
MLKNFKNFFKRGNVIKILFLFIVTFSSRILINNFFSINVFEDFLNPISIVYYFSLATFVVFINENSNFFHNLPSFSQTIININNFILNNFKVKDLSIKDFNLSNIIEFFKSLFILDNKLHIHNNGVESKPVDLLDTKNKKFKEILQLNSDNETEVSRGHKKKSGGSSKSNRLPSYLSNPTQNYIDQVNSNKVNSTANQLKRVKKWDSLRFKDVENTAEPSGSRGFIPYNPNQSPVNTRSNNPVFTPINSKSGANLMDNRVSPALSNESWDKTPPFVDMSKKPKYQEYYSRNSFSSTFTNDTNHGTLGSSETVSLNDTNSINRDKLSSFSEKLGLNNKTNSSIPTNIASLDSASVVNRVQDYSITDMTPLYTNTEDQYWATQHNNVREALGYTTEVNMHNNTRLGYSYDNKNNLKNIYIKVKDSSRRKLFWYLWESRSNNYDNYLDFKKNWDSSTPIRKTILGEISIGLSRDARDLSKDIDHYLKKNDPFQARVKHTHRANISDKRR